ncbi:hypothetical protein C8J57DRAFT_391507 [Mycena rebaudengoi]|nr:hypothetical protein C8J57DRAFT_391507 [Mycena rebaudengoi]
MVSRCGCEGDERVWVRTCEQQQHRKCKQGVRGRRVRGTEDEENVDVVGDADNDKPARSDRTRGKTRRRDRERDREHDGKRERLQEANCPPKMRKRWKASGGEGEVHAAPPSRAQQGSEMVTRNVMHAPPRTDKGKGKARAVDEAMDVDTPGDRLPLPPPRVPPPPLFRSPFAAAVGALRGPIAERQLRAPQPDVPASQRRGACVPRFSLGAGAEMRRTCRREGRKRRTACLRARPCLPLRMSALLRQTHVHHHPQLWIRPRACVSSNPSRSYLSKTRTSQLPWMYIRHTRRITIPTSFSSMSALRSRTARRPRARVPRQSRTRRSR